MIARIDIGGEAFFIAVELIGAYEVHLARQTGLVAGLPKVMGNGGRIRRKFGAVIESSDFGSMLPRKQRKSRWRAYGVVAVGTFENHPVLGQCVDVGRLDHRVPVAGQGPGAQLIGHDHQNVGL